MTNALIPCLKQTVGIALRQTRAVTQDLRQAQLMAIDLVRQNLPARGHIEICWAPMLPGRAALEHRTFAWVIEP